MASFYLKSGHPDFLDPIEVASAVDDLNLDTRHDFLKLFPAQFALICLAAKDVLGIDTAVSEFTTEIPGQRFIMVQMAGGSLAKSGVEVPLVLDFHILKVRAKQDRGINISTESALHTLNRLVNLLAANGNFNKIIDGQQTSVLNIVRLDNMDFQVGPDYTSQFETEHGDQLDGALLSVTFAVTPPLPIAQY